jgi:hypothetical protein
MSSELGDEARRFARGQQSGVLSTLSLRLEGYPFGSVSPFILDHAGRPVILISDIAEHTKNIEADPRVSIIVQPYSTDMQVTTLACTCPALPSLLSIMRCRTRLHNTQRPYATKQRQNSVTADNTGTKKLCTTALKP